MTDIDKLIATLKDIGVKDIEVDPAKQEYRNVTVSDTASDQAVVFVFQNDKFSYIDVVGK